MNHKITIRINKTSRSKSIDFILNNYLVAWIFHSDLHHHRRTVRHVLKSNFGKHKDQANNLNSDINASNNETGEQIYREFRT